MKLIELSASSPLLLPFLIMEHRYLLSSHQRPAVPAFLVPLRTCGAGSGKGLLISLPETLAEASAQGFSTSTATFNVCMSWIIMFGMFLTTFPTGVVMIWLLHQKGLFDPLYDWWEDHILGDEHRYRDLGRRHGGSAKHSRLHHGRHHRYGVGHHPHHNTKHKRRATRDNNGQHHLQHESDYYHYLHHVHKDKDKHDHRKRSGAAIPQRYLELKDDGALGHHRHRNERKTLKQVARTTEHGKEIADDLYWECPQIAWQARQATFEEERVTVFGYLFL